MRTGYLGLGDDDQPPRAAVLRAGPGDHRLPGGGGGSVRLLLNTQGLLSGHHQPLKHGDHAAGCVKKVLARARAPYRVAQGVGEVCGGVFFGVS